MTPSIQVFVSAFPSLGLAKRLVLAKRNWQTWCKRECLINTWRLGLSTQNGFFFFFLKPRYHIKMKLKQPCDEAHAEKNWSSWMTVTAKHTASDHHQLLAMGRKTLRPSSPSITSTILPETEEPHGRSTDLWEVVNFCCFKTIKISMQDISYNWDLLWLPSFML